MKITEHLNGFIHHEKGMKEWHSLIVNVANGKITFYCPRCGDAVIQDFP